MCGIFLFSHTTPLTRLMTPTLAIAMEQRGDNSWGVTDGEFIFKRKGSIIDTFQDCDLDGPVYHTRMATVGVNSDRNAHPFRFEGKNIVTGVHNGHIANYVALKEKYKDRSAFEVDSEHIFAHLAEGKPVAELSGSATVVWYEQPADKSVPMRRYMSRFNSENMHVAKMKSGEIVMASTKDAIIIASQLAGGHIAHFYDTEAKRRYWIEPDPEKPGHMGLYQDMLLPWAEHPVVWSTPSTPTHGHSYGGFRGRGGLHSITGDSCPSRMCADGKLKTDEVICAHCFSELRKDIFGDQSSATV